MSSEESFEPDKIIYCDTPPNVVETISLDALTNRRDALKQGVGAMVATIIGLSASTKKAQAEKIRTPEAVRLLNEYAQFLLKDLRFASISKQPIPPRVSVEPARDEDKDQQGVFVVRVAVNGVPASLEFGQISMASDAQKFKEAFGARLIRHILQTTDIFMFGTLPKGSNLPAEVVKKLTPNAIHRMRQELGIEILEVRATIYIPDRIKSAGVTPRLTAIPLDSENVIEILVGERGPEILIQVRRTNGKKNILITITPAPDGRISYALKELE